MLTTARLHAEADAAAQQGDFRGALARSADVLRASPHDHRARQKAALCLAALGEREDAVAALLIVARGLARRGFSLAALAACRDGLALAPGHPALLDALSSIHDGIGGKEVAGPAVGRVPPPIAPLEVPEDAPRLVSDAPDLVSEARALALLDPDPATTPERVDPQPVPFFSDLRREAFVELFPRATLRKLPAGASVMTQGDPGRSLVIIVAGEVEVTRRDDSGRPVTVARLGPGQLIGEMSLLTQKPRSASVRTTRPSELFEVDRPSVETVAARTPAVVEDLVRFARRRLIANLVATSPIFRSLAPAQRVEVVQAFEQRTAKAGEVLIEEGAPPKGLYLVLEGEVEVSLRDADGDRLVLAYLREGQVVGEIALVEDGLTTATVTATERSVLLHLPKARFEQVVSAHPELAAYLRTLSSERLLDKEGATLDAHVVDADELVLL